ncbi:MAG: Beta-ketoadipate enol-lactone hydrolase [Sphingomonas bacterium]|uniref:alpha/beta fold hydrolase n=1 Tax=Sphingomonas bacterium TaxID=1895847 RepID=UPI00261B9BB3|nr:alpha/beta fold hydrolase [Sphingomonas bacterium]MDB5705518.1 Beta-ketoadipate enol-lactone hydrolase [Sphingomonas bacterium]
MPLMIPVIAAAAAALIAGLAAFSHLAARRIERQVPVDGQFATIDGIRLHYTDRGHGPAIVMIHGLGGQMRNFGYALTDLLVADHRVILVDRPGSGYSAAAPSAAIPDQARLVTGLIDALDLEKPLVVGHSLGGAVALALALDHPAKVGGLALISPLTQVQEQVPAAFRGIAIGSPALRRAIAWTIATPLGMLSGRRGAIAVFAPEAAPDDFGTKGGGALVLRPGSFHAASTDLAAARASMPALVARYADLAVPVAILFGREDAILDPELHGAKIAGDVPRIELTLIPGGHMIPVTAAETVADWIRDRVTPAIRPAVQA